MEFTLRVSDAAMRPKGSITRATNGFGDLLSAILDRGDVGNRWRPTLELAFPEVRVTLAESYLESGKGCIIIKPCGRDGAAWLWRMTLETDAALPAMTQRDRAGIDRVINAMFDVVDYVRQQEAFYD